LVKAITREPEILEAMHEMWRRRSAVGRARRHCQTMVRPPQAIAVPRLSPHPDGDVPLSEAADALREFRPD